jgi:hypothetical protein
MLTRRTFIASLLGAIAAPRLALPAPLPDMIEMVPPLVVAFCQTTHDAGFMALKTRTVIWGSAARDALAANPQLWSAVMVDWSIDRPGTFSGRTPQQVAAKVRAASRA